MECNENNFYWEITPIITAIFALIIVYANARFGLRNKQADLIIHFHKQYDELQKKRVELLNAQIKSLKPDQGAWSQQQAEIEAEVFFDRFWSLQFDQFLAWHEGYIPTQIYTYWLFSRWRELHDPSTNWTIFDKNLATTLNELKARWHSSPDKGSKLSIHASKFLTLMYSLKNTETTIAMDQHLRSAGASPVRRIARWLFGAN